MRILGNTSVERLDVSESLESSSLVKPKKQLGEYLGFKVAKNKIHYQACLYHLKCGLALYMILSTVRFVWLILSKGNITPDVCEEMHALFVWDMIESSISILSVFIGLLAIKLDSATMYDKFLALLVINLSLKIIIASYILSFSAEYVVFCLQCDQEGAYPMLLADGAIFLYFLYHGVILRSFLAESQPNERGSSVPLLNNKVELIELD